MHSNFQPLQNPPTMAPLDYHKIKDFLKQQVLNPDSEVEICATLQALSWRITKVPAPIRRQNMHSFQHYDLLEIKQADSPMSIIKLYLS